jgi:RNA polymerase primary sigma factor
MIIDVTVFRADGIAGKGGGGSARAIQDKARPARCPGPDNQHRPASAGPCPGRFEAPVALGSDMEGDFVLRLYLRDISNTSRAMPAGGPQAAHPGRLNDSGRQQLVLGHLPRVVRIAFDYRGLGLPLGDLIGEGNIGLMRAAELFDPVRKVAFACYAKPWIRVQMQRALSYQAWPVSLPADFAWRRGHVQAAKERLAAKLNRAPQDTELADECGLDLPAVRRLRSAPPPSFVPLDSPCPGNETDLTLAEVIPDETSPAPDRQAALHSDRDFVDRLIVALSPVERKVIRLRFGLGDGCQRTLGEVGRLLGYGRQGIHRLQSVALAKLRQHARFLQAAPGTRGEIRNPKLSIANRR